MVAERDLLPDLVRAVAVVGIAVVNVGVFVPAPWEDPSRFGSVEAVVDALVRILLTDSSRPLFAFMFGVGFGYLFARSREGFGGIYLWRLLALFAIGGLHSLLAFEADILGHYAIVGALVWPFRHHPPSALVQWGIVLSGLQVVIFAVDYADIIGMDYESFWISWPDYDGVPFAQAAHSRLQGWSWLLVANLFSYGPLTLAFFLWGLAAHRADIVNSPGHIIWQRLRSQALPLGLMISGIAFAASQTGLPDALRLAAYYLGVAGSALLALGWLGAMAYLADRLQGREGPASRLVSRLASGGGAPLSAYVGTSLILSFCAYGLDTDSRIDAGQAYALAAIVAVGLLLVLGAWRSDGRRGPLEAGLHRLSHPT